MIALTDALRHLGGWPVACQGASHPESKRSTTSTWISTDITITKGACLIQRFQRLDFRRGVAGGGLELQHAGTNAGSDNAEVVQSHRLSRIAVCLGGLDIVQ